jgi:plastocyanin
MRALPLLILGTLALLSGPATARAGFVLSDFESGLSGWQSAGDALTVNASFGLSPTQGSNLGLLTTASINGDFNTFSGTDAVSATALEGFLGLSTGTLASGFEGSALLRSITVNAGDTLTFDYNYLSTDVSANDFAFLTLNGALTSLVSSSGPLTPSLAVLDPIFGDPTTETGWRTFSVTFTTAGTYNLGLGVVDAGDEFFPSALAVDNVQVTAGAAQAVPEPSTLTLLAIGLACAGVYRWRSIARRPAEG